MAFNEALAARIKAVAEQNAAKRPEKGKTNTPAKKPAKAFTFSDIGKPGSKPTTQEKKPARSVLFGTGITQKLAAKTGTHAKRNLEAANAWLAKQNAQSKPEKLLQTAETYAPEHLAKSINIEGISLDPSQTKAVAGQLANKYACVIGRAGTGKTTSVKASLMAAVSDWLETHDEPPIIKFIAPTGIAAQRLKSVLPEEYHTNIDTIHGMLEFAPEFYDVWDEENSCIKKTMQFIPRRNEFNKLDVDILVCDEAGMYSVQLWNQTWLALPERTRITLMGDLNQIPPIHGKSVLGFAMLKWPTFEMSTLHRTGEDAAIATQAHRVLDGHMPKTHAPQVFMKAISRNEREAFREIIGATFLLRKKGVFKPNRDGIIVAMNEGMLGQQHLNQFLAREFNEEQKVDGVVINPRVPISAGSQHTSFAVGDKVMLTKNIREAGLANGMTGLITNIRMNAAFEGRNGHSIIDPRLLAQDRSKAKDFDGSEFDSIVQDVSNSEPEEKGDSERAASHAITVHFADIDDEYSFSTAGEVNSLQLAYAFTCHKAQGGEYETVILVVHDLAMMMMCREWIYTGMTRAKTRLIILYTQQALQTGVRRQRIKGNTLEEKAHAFLAEQSKTDKEQPELPEPLAL